MDYLNIAKNIVEEVDAKVKRIYWTNEEIDKWFGKRSPNEVLKAGHTFFMNPCLDLTLVSSKLLSSKKIPHFLVIEEHPPTKDFDFNRLHFVLEIKNKEEYYTLNYKENNLVEIYNGEYKGREDIPSIGGIKMNSILINYNYPLYKNLRYKSLEDLTKNVFENFSLNKNIERLKKDNSKENYEAFKKTYGDKFKINLKQ